MSIDSINEDVTGELIPVNENDYEIIEAEEQAITYLERIQARKHKLNKIKELYQERVQALQDKIDQAYKWLDEEETKLNSEIGWLIRPLEDFMRAINASNPKIKSLNLPTGKLKLRKLPDKVIIMDGFKATKDDLGKPGIVEKISYDVNKTEIKKHIEETGEVLDYAHIEPGETKFEYEVME